MVKNNTTSRPKWPTTPHSHGTGEDPSPAALPRTLRRSLRRSARCLEGTKFFFWRFGKAQEATSVLRCFEPVLLEDKTRKTGYIIHSYSCNSTHHIVFKARLFHTMGCSGKHDHAIHLTHSSRWCVGVRGLMNSWDEQNPRCLVCGLNTIATSRLE